MRKHSLLAVSTLALVSAFAAPRTAQAACSEPAGRCGDGSGKNIIYKSTDEVLLPAVGFNWTSAPYNVDLSVVNVDLRARANFGFTFAQLTDPVKGGVQPLYSVNLDKAPLAATWSAETKVITIKRVEGTSDTASIDVRYTVRPNAHIAADYKLHSQPDTSYAELAHYDYDLTDIFSDVIGNPNFGIDGMGQQKFKPWALTGIEPFVVPGGGLPGGAGNNSALFNKDWAYGNVDTDNFAANGSFGVYAKTDPAFSYKTLSVKYGDKELADDVTVDLPTQSEYGNSVKVPVKVHGGVRIDGQIQANPYLTLNQVTVLGFGPFDIDHTFETGIQALTQPVAIPDAAGGLMEFDFPTSSEVEIPIPNVKLAKPAVEFDGTVGTEASGKVTIKNEGLAPAKITFEPTGDFTLSSTTTEISPGSSFDLTVKANPNAAGTVDGSVKIHTNDPDSPLLDLTVAGTFKDAPVPPPPGDDDDDDTNTSSSSSGGKTGGQATDTADDSGCGCKTAGTSSSNPLAALGGLALGAVAILRRRRKN